MKIHHVVVDGSNIATEGRDAPSLAQLDEAVQAFVEEYSPAHVTVVVDATFPNRIERKERQTYEDAVNANELITPPAGAIGRGDAFVLQIARRAGADDPVERLVPGVPRRVPVAVRPGRLIGGKPVPHVGWVFMDRAPVRGPTSRRSVSEARKLAKAAEDVAEQIVAEAPAARSSGAEPSRPRRRSRAKAAPEADGPDAGQGAERARGRRGPASRSPPPRSGRTARTTPTPPGRPRAAAAPSPTTRRCRSSSSSPRTRSEPRSRRPSSASARTAPTCCVGDARAYVPLRNLADPAAAQRQGGAARGRGAALRRRDGRPASAWHRPRRARCGRGARPGPGGHGRARRRTGLRRHRRGGRGRGQRPTTWRPSRRRGSAAAKKAAAKKAPAKKASATRKARPPKKASAEKAPAKKAAARKARRGGRPPTRRPGPTHRRRMHRRRTHRPSDAPPSDAPASQDLGPAPDAPAADEQTAGHEACPRGRRRPRRPPRRRLRRRRRPRRRRRRRAGGQEVARRGRPPGRPRPRPSPPATTPPRPTSCSCRRAMTTRRGSRGLSGRAASARLPRPTRRDPGPGPSIGSGAVRIATWNVNSLTGERIDRVVGWLDIGQPDVLCLQETKLADDAFPALEFHARGYESVHHGEGRWNGVAILSRVGLDDPVAGFADGEAADDEARLVTATCGGVRVSSVYVPNGRAVGHDHFHYKLRWLARLRAHVAADGGADRPRAVCGDVNVAPDDLDVWSVAAFEGSTHVTPEERAALAELQATRPARRVPRAVSRRRGPVQLVGLPGGQLRQAPGHAHRPGPPVSRRSPSRSRGRSSIATPGRAASPATTRPSSSTSTSRAEVASAGGGRPGFPHVRRAPSSRRSVDRRRLRRRRTRLRGVAGAPRRLSSAAPTARRAELHRMGQALRRIVHRLHGSPAPDDELAAAADELERLADRLDAFPSRSLYEGFGESPLAGSDPHAFFDHSPMLGRANPLAPPIQLWVEDDVMYGRATFGAAYEGPPGCVHGGYVAAAFDEVLGSTQSLAGRPGMTVRLTVNYRSPTPLHTELTFAGRVDAGRRPEDLHRRNRARRRSPVRRERGPVRGHRLHEGRGAAPPARGGVRHRRRGLTRRPRQRQRVERPVVGQGAAELGEPARQRQPRPVAATGPARSAARSSTSAPGRPGRTGRASRCARGRSGRRPRRGAGRAAPRGRRRGRTAGRSARARRRRPGRGRATRSRR